MGLTLCSGVEFDEEKHEYFYKGKRLSGITGIISSHLGKKYSDFTEEYREEGLHTHKAVQKYIETGEAGSVHPGVVWLTGELKHRYIRQALFSEVLVSDFKSYASLVDIIAEDEDDDRLLDIFDIKTGKMQRESVTWQLSVYKYLIESYTAYRVRDCFCISLKDEEFWPVFAKAGKEVEKLLYNES